MCNSKDRERREGEEEVERVKLAKLSARGADVEEKLGVPRCPPNFAQAA